ncbi:MAG: hypothetical protein H6735_24230 [Alphaproteobacteria bacterium]|nr:hypothetical protein [Alphaproteobacteria bacterium]
MLLLLSALSPAHAVTYDGTPVLGFRVDRPAADYVSGSVVLEGLRIFHCGGGYTDVSVGATFDPVAGGTVTIPSGDHCQITFSWSSVMSITGSGFTLEMDGETTVVPLDAPIDPVYLSSYTVTSGSMSGYGPWLLVDID